MHHSRPAMRWLFFPIPSYQMWLWGTLVLLFGCLFWEFLKIFPIDPKYVNSLIFRINGWLIHIMLLLAITAIFKRRILWTHFLWVCLLAFYANDFRLIEYHFHNFLFDNSLYPSFTQHNGNSFVNPQYAVILCFFAAYIGLLAIVLLRKTRSFDRIFVFISLNAVLLTTLLFHYIIINQSLNEWQNKFLHDVKTILQAANEHTFFDLCRVNQLYCQASPAQHPVALNAQVDDMMNKTLAYLLQRPNRAGLHTWASSVRSDSPVVVNYLMGVAYEPTIGIRAVLDSDRYYKTIDEHHARFSILCIAAHFVWVILAYTLLSYHHHRFAKRHRKT